MQTKTKALIAVIIGYSIFGFSFLFSKVALQITVPTVLVAIRFAMAFIVLNLIVLIGKNVKKSDGTPLIEFSLRGKPKKILILMTIFQPVIYFIAENYGILYTSSTFAGIIVSVIPIMGLIADRVIMKNRLTKKKVFFSVASTIGVMITTIGSAEMTASPLGFGFLMIAVTAGAMYLVCSSKAAAHYTALERTYAMFMVGSIFYIIVAAIQCGSRYEELIRPAIISPAFWGCIMYLAIVSSVGAFMLINYGSGYVPVSTAALFNNLATVISIIAGVLILHESFTIQQLIGTVVILVSVYMAGIS